MPDEETGLPWLYGVAHKVLGHQWRSRSRKAKLAERLQSIGVEPTNEPEELVVVQGGVTSGPQRHRKAEPVR